MQVCGCELTLKSEYFASQRLIVPTALYVSNQMNSNGHSVLSVAENPYKSITHTQFDNSNGYKNMRSTHTNTRRNNHVDHIYMHMFGVVVGQKTE